MHKTSAHSSRFALFALVFSLSVSAPMRASAEQIEVSSLRQLKALLSEPPGAENGTAKGQKDRAKKERLLREAGNTRDFDAEAEKKREQQIETLMRVIPKSEGLAKADLLFRLAELYWEKSRTSARAAVLEYDRAMDAFLASEGAESAPESAPKEPRLDDFLSESELYRHEALRAYGAILENWPGYPRRDEVLFADAYNKGELGRKAEAAAGYRQLIGEFPNSKLAFDASVQLGELEFEAGHLMQAKAAYEKGLEAPSSPLRNFARYRLAWCDFNAGEDETGVERLKEVIREAGEASLAREAMNDLSGGFARLEDMSGAIAWFSGEAEAGRLKTVEARHLVRRTALALLASGKTSEARAGLSWLIDKDPLDPEGPKDQRAVAESFEAERDREGVLRELKVLASRYGPDTDWQKANANNPDVLKKGMSAAEEAMRTLVADYHQEAQRTQNAATYRVARDIYAEYLARFPDSPNAPQLAFFHGEILWALGEFEDAARQYDLSFQKDSAGQYAREAAYDAVLAWEKAVSAEKKRSESHDSNAALKDSARVREGEKKAALKKGSKEAILKGKRAEDALPSPAAVLPLTETERALVLAIDRFAASFPKDSEATEARYRAAHLFFAHQDDVQAAQRISALIVDFPEDRWSRRAMKLALDLLTRQRAWKALHTEAARFAQNAALMHGDKTLKASLEDLSEGALYKHWDETVLPRGGEQAKREAAEGFLRLAEDYPSSKYAPLSAYHALVTFEDAGSLAQALASGDLLLQKWPKAEAEDGRKLGEDALLRTGAILFRAGDLKEASLRLNDYAARRLSGIESARTARTESAKQKRGRGAAAEARTETAEDAGLAAALLMAAKCEEALADGGSAEAAEAHARAARQHLLSFAENFPARSEAPESSLRAASILANSLASPFPGAEEAMAALRASSGKNAAATLSPIRRLQALAQVVRWLQPSSEKKWAENPKVGRAEEKQRAALSGEASKLAEETFEALTDEEKSGSLAKDAIGEVRFARLEAPFEAARAIGFDESMSARRLKSLLEDKLKRVGELEASYLSLAAFGAQKWTLASLVRLGELYADLAQKLLDSPDPPDLSPEEIDMYREALEARAFPLEEKAIQAFEAAMTKALELKAYGPWLAEAGDGLSELKKGSLMPSRDAGFFFTTMRHSGERTEGGSP